MESGDELRQLEGVFTREKKGEGRGDPRPFIGGRLLVVGARVLERIGRRRRLPCRRRSPALGVGDDKWGWRVSGKREALTAETHMSAGWKREGRTPSGIRPGWALGRIWE
jgi:hypothetical protein